MKIQSILFAFLYLKHYIKRWFCVKNSRQYTCRHILSKCNYWCVIYFTPKKHTFIKNIKFLHQSFDIVFIVWLIISNFMIYVYKSGDTVFMLFHCLSRDVCPCSVIRSICAAFTTPTESAQPNCAARLVLHVFILHVSNRCVLFTFACNGLVKISLLTCEYREFIITKLIHKLTLTNLET